MAKVVPRRGRWVVAAVAWVLCSLMSGLLLIGEPAGIGAIARWLLSFPAMIAMSLYFAAWIQRRPGESKLSIFVSTFATGLLGTAWMLKGPGSLLAVGLIAFPEPIEVIIRFRLWHYVLGIGAIALPIACVTLALLFTWMSLRMKLVLALLTTVAYVAISIVLAEWPSVIRSIGAELGFPYVVSMSGVVLAWSCIARPYSGDWAHQCRKCGYDIRGLRAESCPECGAKLPRWVVEELQGVIEPAPDPESPPPPTPPPSTAPPPSP